MTTGPLALLALGFVLGMRHATDADHLVAVAAFAHRERSARAPRWGSAPCGGSATASPS